MKRPVLSALATLGLASFAAFVLPASANAMGAGNHSGVGNVFVACSISNSSSSSTLPLSFSFLQASSGVTIKTPSIGSSCADAVAAVEALGLHVVAEETVVPVGATAAAAAPLLIIHLDNTNPGGNTSTGGNNWNNHGGNPGSNTGHNTGGNTGGTGMQ